MTGKRLELQNRDGQIAIRAVRDALHQLVKFGNLQPAAGTEFLDLSSGIIQTPGAAPSAAPAASSLTIEYEDASGLVKNVSILQLLQQFFTIIPVSAGKVRVTLKTVNLNVATSCDGGTLQLTNVNTLPTS